MSSLQRLSTRAAAAGRLPGSIASLRKHDSHARSHQSRGLHTLSEPCTIPLCSPTRARSRPRQRISHVDQRRTLFGIGEIVGVLSNPAEVVRNLTESKRLLEEARQDIKEMKERAQLPPKHTFAPLPGFFERKREIQAIERALSGVPTFNVLFGASSVGKTALCRQILCKPIYHVLHYDLRIAGFADLASLYYALSTQMEQYFVEISKRLPGYEDFEKESYTFKHDRLALEKRVEAGGEVKTSDIAKTMELFQSALLKYWSFEPTLQSEDSETKSSSPSKPDKSASGESLKTARTVKVESDPATEAVISSQSSPAPAPRTGTTDTVQSEEKEAVPPKKLIPVIFFDEAHRLPLLIKDKKAMKCILDAMLVLTKQDRLIHVIHATSDPFYNAWLRQLNIMQHCKIMSIGDAAKDEAHRYFQENLLAEVPEKLKSGLRFEELFEVFGGKLAHLSDYVADYVNADGKLNARRSSHYAQAHSLLNLQLIHSVVAPAAAAGEVQSQATGFNIYSPLEPGGNDDGNPDAGPDFTAGNLLTVCKRLLTENSLSYFKLCREMGARAVDGLIRGRILELRWVETVTPEYDIEQSITETGPLLLPTTPVIRAAMKQVVEEWKHYKDAEPQLSE